MKISIKFTLPQYRLLYSHKLLLANLCTLILHRHAQYYARTLLVAVPRPLESPATSLNGQRKRPARKTPRKSCRHRCNEQRGIAQQRRPFMKHTCTVNIAGAARRAARTGARISAAHYPGPPPGINLAGAPRFLSAEKAAKNKRTTTRIIALSGRKPGVALC